MARSGHQSPFVIPSFWDGAVVVSLGPRSQNAQIISSHFEVVCGHIWEPVYDKQPIRRIRVGIGVETTSAVGHIIPFPFEMGDLTGIVIFVPDEVVAIVGRKKRGGLLVDPTRNHSV